MWVKLKRCLWLSTRSASDIGLPWIDVEMNQTIQIPTRLELEGTLKLIQSCFSIHRQGSWGPKKILSHGHPARSWSFEGCVCLALHCSPAGLQSPLISESLHHSLHLRVEPSSWLSPFARSHPSSVTGFPRVPPWFQAPLQTSGKCRPLTLVSFGWESMTSPKDRVSEQFFKTRIAKCSLKEIWWRHKQVVFSHFGCCLWTFPYYTSFPRTRLLIWFTTVIILLIQFCILLFSTCAPLM